MMASSTGISIAHLNIRGLLNKIDEIKYLLVKYGYKIFHLCETFLTPAISDSLLSIPNYNFIHNDRVGKKGGGVLSYIHSSLNFSILDKPDHLISETLIIKITPKAAKSFITSVVYRRPRSTNSWYGCFTNYVT